MFEKFFNRESKGPQKSPEVSEIMSSEQRAQMDVWLLSGDVRAPEGKEDGFDKKVSAFRKAWLTGNLGAGEKRAENEEMLALLRDQYLERIQAAKNVQEIITDNPKVFRTFMEKKYGDMLKTMPIEKLTAILFKHIEKLAFQNGSDMNDFGENLLKLKNLGSVKRLLVDYLRAANSKKSGPEIHQDTLNERENVLHTLKTTFERYRSGDTEASQALLADLDAVVLGKPIKTKEADPFSNAEANKDAQLYREAVNPNGEKWKEIEQKWEEQKKGAAYTKLETPKEKRKFLDTFFEGQFDLLQTKPADAETEKKSSDTLIGRMLRKIFGAFGKKQLKL